MLDKNNIGKIFLLPNYEQVQIFNIGIVGNKEWYYINDNYPKDVGNGFPLWSESDLNFYESKQEKWKESKIIYEIKQKEYKEKERIQAEIKKENEYLYNYDANMSPMQKAKVLKCLMKSLVYDNGVMTRKDYVIMKLKQGYTLNIKTFSNAYNRRAKNDTTTYRILEHPTNNTFNDITKTEYDFAEYLLKNNIIPILQIV